MPRDPGRCDAIEGIDGQRIFSSKDGEFESEGAAIAFGELEKEKRDREDEKLVELTFVG